ncbi:MAG TPA: DNA polymerase III subunit alpha [Chloroflexota bacterium]|nr:DNA polymerase III subunit alpha [Chloroflexota bacterium]
MTDFAHLHVHTEFSLLDGLSKVESLLDRVKELGMTSVAMTDHGNMHGAIDFYKAAKARDLNPIVGAEIYVAERRLHQKEGPLDRENYHLTLLARDLDGYKNLMRILSIAHLEGMYYKPRVDHEVLRQHSGGLIALSGCCGSEVSQAILRNNPERATRLAEEYRDIFGAENYYFELQMHQLEEQRRVNAGLLEMAARLKVPVVATNDSHYTRKDDVKAHDILLCIQVAKDYDDPNRFRLTGEDFYLRSPEEMAELFKDTPAAIENTLAIAERCHLDIPMGNWILPNFAPPGGAAPEEYIRDVVHQAMEERYAPVGDEVRQRVDYELDVIVEKGYSTYMLIVADYVNWAKQQGIAVGPGRGSAAGSVVSYLLKITGLDPFFYKLPFERFLNRERPSGPDIDMDFSDKRRDEVLAYVAQKYGEDRVARICTFGTMGARAAIRDVGRVLAVPYGEIDRMCKLIPPDKPTMATSIAMALEQVAELRTLRDGSPKVAEVLALAQTLEGTVRHVSMHACGVVIGDRPLVEYLPLMRPSGSAASSTAGVAALAPSQDWAEEADPSTPAEDSVVSTAAGLALVSQYEFNAVEKTGLLKMDFLGLINLSMIENTIAFARQTQGVEIDIAAIPLDDAATYELFGTGEMTGIFQMESAGMRRYVQQLKPSTIFDIAAMVALYRPGPMNTIPTFIERKHDASKVVYLDPRLEPILRESYGVVTYQDDVLLIAVQMAGFSWAEADALRKAMGKKIAAEMEAQREKLLSGLVANGGDFGLTEEKARQLWTLIEPFAGYGFNKAHAASYGLVAYQTAYLKANYPVEFMTAVLSAQQGNAEKVAAAVAECRRMEVQVLPPDVNESDLDFTIVPSKAAGEGRSHAIRFGLAAVKNVGRGAAEAIIHARNEKGPFTSLDELCNRIDLHEVNRKVLEALIKCGALDACGGALGGRNGMLEALERVVSAAQQAQRAAAVGQSTMFDMMLVGGSGSDTLGDDGRRAIVPFAAVLDDTPSRLKLAWEKEHLGLYLSDHPLMPLQATLEALRTVAISDIEQDLAGSRITIGGMISAQRKIVTRQGKMMLAATIEDLTGSLEVIVFPRTYDETGSHWVAEAPVLVTGKVDYRDEVPQLLCETVQPLEELMATREVRYVQVDVPDTGDQTADVECLRKIISALRRYPGTDRFSLCFRGGYRLEDENATTFWNPKLEQDLHRLLGPSRVQLLQPEQEAFEYQAERAG